MILSYNRDKKIYLLKTNYSEYTAHGQKIKDARFKWNALDKIWWTDKEENASLLISCADDDAYTRLSKTASNREISLIESRSEDADLGNMLDGILRAPYPFQKAGIQYALARKAVLFGDEPGLGKTLQALVSVHLHNAYPCIAVVPSTLKINWMREAILTIPEIENRIAILKGSPREFEDLSSYKLIVINYDILGRWLRLLENVIKAKSLVLDESHYAKNREAQRTKACISLSQGIEYKYLLSGTALVNRPIELESQLEILGVLDQFGGPWGFKQRYCGAWSEHIYVKSRRGPKRRLIWHFDGATNLNELQRKLREIVMVRRQKRDVLKELPPVSHQTIELPSNGLTSLINKELAAYKRMGGEFDNFEKASEGLGKSYQASFSEMAILRRKVAVAKVPQVVEHVKALMEEYEKVTIFCHHHDVVNQLKEDLKEYGVVILTGDETEKQKDAAVQEFQNGKARIFIGSILASGIGITLVAAWLAVVIEFDWSPGKMEQVVDRLHRIGQTNAVLAQYIVLENSLDSKMIGMLIDKQKVLDAVLDNPIPMSCGRT